MALAPNPFLQATPVAKSKPAIAVPVAKAAETSKDSASSFAQVYSKQADSKPVVSMTRRGKRLRTSQRSSTTNTQQTLSLPPPSETLPIAANPCLPTKRQKRRTTRLTKSPLTQWRLMLHRSRQCLIQR